MTELPGDYGVVLTYALFRGFTDLGPRMTETYLLFLNADFIISDGSLRHLGKLMLEGKRVIHAPSFRVVLEDAWPKLQAAVNPSTGALDMGARDMVKLALAHKHVTVKARTVNQRLCHQTWMDQFYWYVDDATLIGYQWPVALVAIKPERVVMEPVLVWDYGFIPEAAPTAPETLHRRFRRLLHARATEAQHRREHGAARLDLDRRHRAQPVQMDHQGATRVRQAAACHPCRSAAGGPRHHDRRIAGVYGAGLQPARSNAEVAHWAQLARRLVRLCQVSHARHAD